MGSERHYIGDGRFVVVITGVMRRGWVQWIAQLRVQVGEQLLPSSRKHRAGTRYHAEKWARAALAEVTGSSSLLQERSA